MKLLYFVVFLPLIPCQARYAAKAAAAVISPGTRDSCCQHQPPVPFPLCKLGLVLQPPFCQIPPSLSMCTRVPDA